MKAINRRFVLKNQRQIAPGVNLVYSEKNGSLQSITCPKCGGVAEPAPQAGKNRFHCKSCGSQLDSVRM